jgi:hypothetical protein
MPAPMTITPRRTLNLQAEKQLSQPATFVSDPPDDQENQVYNVNLNPNEQDGGVPRPSQSGDHFSLYIARWL